MKKFDLVKTVQLVLLILLTVIAIILVLVDRELYTLIAGNAHIRSLSIVLWVVLALSYLFLLYDFSSYAGLKRENMELDNAIYHDSLTGISNRYAMDVYISQFINKPLPSDMGAVTLDITNLSEINQVMGHTGGDEALQQFSEVLQQAVSGVCTIGRNGGNKFLAIIRDCSEKRMEKFVSSVEKGLEELNEKRGKAPIRICIGTAFNEGDEVRSLTELIALSNRRAYQRRG